jgi:hypothetical protein
LPDPFGRAVTVPPLLLTDAFQLFWTLWLPFGLIVTTQLLEPLTVKFTLNRSDHSSARETLTEQLPPPPLGGGVVLPPPEAVQDAVGRAVLPFL